MILDREGDLVLTDAHNLLLVDVGGFLFLATAEELAARLQQRIHLQRRYYDRQVKQKGTLRDYLAACKTPPSPAPTDRPPASS